VPAHFKKGLVDGVHQESSGTGHFVQKVTFEKMGVTRMHGPGNSKGFHKAEAKSDIMG
jgi:hypothetical protein